VSTLKDYQAPNHEVVHLNALLIEASDAEQITTAGSEILMYMPRFSSSSKLIKPLPGDELPGMGLKS
jgi:hypothetical protein